MSKLHTLLILIIFCSCHRTKNNKFVLEKFRMELYPLEIVENDNSSPAIDYQIYNEGQLDTNYKLLILIFEKRYVSDMKNGDVPFEGMDGNLDSIKLISIGDFNFHNKKVNCSGIKNIGSLVNYKSGTYKKKDKEYGFNYLEKVVSLDTLMSNYNNCLGLFGGTETIDLVSIGYVVDYNFTVLKESKIVTNLHEVVVSD